MSPPMIPLSSCTQCCMCPLYRLFRMPRPPIITSRDCLAQSSGRYRWRRKYFLPVCLALAIYGLSSFCVFFGFSQMPSSDDLLHLPSLYPNFDPLLFSTASFLPLLAAPFLQPPVPPLGSVSPSASHSVPASSPSTSSSEHLSPFLSPLPPPPPKPSSTPLPATDQRVILLYPFEGCMDERAPSSSSYPMLLGKSVRDSVMRDLSYKVAEFLHFSENPSSFSRRLSHDTSFSYPSFSSQTSPSSSSSSTALPRSLGVSSTSPRTVPLDSRYLSALQMEVTMVPPGMTDRDLAELAESLPCVQNAFLDSNKYSPTQLVDETVEKEEVGEEGDDEIIDVSASAIPKTVAAERRLQGERGGYSFENIDPLNVVKHFEKGVLPCDIERRLCPKASSEAVPSPASGASLSAGVAGIVAAKLLKTSGTAKTFEGIQPLRGEAEGADSGAKGPVDIGYSEIPTDKQFPLQWSLREEEPMSIQVEKVWPWWTGQSRPLTVAVIDSGCDLNHPDLKNKVWKNPGEICGDGIDNDNNGFVDDCNGYDFANEDPDPSPSNSGHGTGAAGIIGAESNNEKGIAGICWGCNIMCLKFIGHGQGKVSDQVQAIDYAVKMGAKISNNSYGGYGFSKLEYSAIERAQVAGHLFVCSAGNNNLDTDISRNNHTPSSYELHNIVAVGAVDNRGRKARFSNFGKNSVDVFAPGVRIRTVETNNRYSTVSGTSFAAPAAAGAAGLLWSAFPGLSHIQVKQLLVDGCIGQTEDPVVKDLSTCGGRLNVHRSLYVGALMQAGIYPGHDVLAKNGGLRPTASDNTRGDTPAWTTTNNLPVSNGGALAIAAIANSLRTGGVGGIVPKNGSINNRVGGITSVVGGGRSVSNPMLPFVTGGTGTGNSIDLVGLFNSVFGGAAN